MLALAGSIILSSLLGVIFKYFDKYGIDTFTAVVVNYFVCVGTGFFFANKGTFSILAMISQPWTWYAVFIGLVFIISFMIFAKSVQAIGIMVTSIFQKMSLIAPVIIGIFIFGEANTTVKWSGILLSLIAILLVNHNKKTENEVNNNGHQQMFLLPLLTFVGSCVADSLIFVVEHKNLISQNDVGFVSSIFLFAGLFGLAFLLITIRSRKIRPKDILGGLILGVPNFFSIYFIVVALQKGMDGSIVFPLNNLGVLLLAGAFGLFLFGEKISAAKVVGYLCSILAILLLSFAS
jgi:drug/metabolite transporter (DMT)-like permease